MKKYDYIIIGSGIAGLYTALLAKEYGSVLIITKGSISECNTKYAQGGIAAAIGRAIPRNFTSGTPSPPGTGYAMKNRAHSRHRSPRPHQRPRPFRCSV